MPLFGWNNSNSNSNSNNNGDALQPQLQPTATPTHPASSRLGDIEAIDLEVTILQGENLTPKDRSWFGLGRLTSSDPYVKVLLIQEFPDESTSDDDDDDDDEVDDDDDDDDSTLQHSSQHSNGHHNGNLSRTINNNTPTNSVTTPTNSPPRNRHSMSRSIRHMAASSKRFVAHHAPRRRRHHRHHNAHNLQNMPRGIHKIKLGRTQTIYKTLHPVWNETLVGKLKGKIPLQFHTPDHPAVLEFHILDEDPLKASDPMGIVRIAVPLATHGPIDSTQWYEVPPDSARRAQGRLLIRIKTTLQRCHHLVRGNSFELNASFGEPQNLTPNNNKNKNNKRNSQIIQLGLSWDVLPKPIIREQDNPLSSGTGNSNSKPFDDFVSGFPGVPPLPSQLQSHPRRRRQRQLELEQDEQAQYYVDLDASCVAISHHGHVIMPDTVYYGNLSNSNRSVLHSGDARQGTAHGDDESITLYLDRIPNHVLAMYIILTVSTPNMTLADVQSTRVRVLDITPLPITKTSRKQQKKQKKQQQKQQQSNENTYRPEQTLCVFAPSNHLDSGDATAMFMLRIARDYSSSQGGIPAPVNGKVAVSQKWILTPIQDTHPTARDFGGLIPHVKAYTRDLVPNIVVDPTERVAILRKGGAIRIQDYCRQHRLPQKLTFGLAWDVTNGERIDLDASAICLDKNFNLIDMVWWKQLHSKDYNIIHHGDEREGDEIGDDELIDLYLNNMTLMGEHCQVEYIGFVINSYSGQNLKDVDRASCHLFDPKTNIEMATYALSNAKALEGYTSLLVGCLYRASSRPNDFATTNNNNTETTPTGNQYHAAVAASQEGEWCLCIISEASNGRTVKGNVEGFQNYLRQHPPQPAPPLLKPVQGSSLTDNTRQQTGNNNNSNNNIEIHAQMPPSVPLANEGSAMSMLESDELSAHLQNHLALSSPTMSSITATPLSSRKASSSPMIPATPPLSSFSPAQQQPMYSQYSHTRR